MNNCDKWYKCRASDFSVNAYGGCGRIHEVFHTRSNIIRIARDIAGKNGTSLEDFAGIATIDTEDGGWEYVRELSDEEEFKTALEYLRHDGHIFEVVEELCTQSDTDNSGWRPMPCRKGKAKD